MAQFWKASSVTVNNGSKIVTVNTGDDVANIITNSMLQISNFQYVEVKTVNTVNQTIELFFDWDKGNVSAQPAIAAPNRAAIKEAVEELRALRQTYEGLASDVSVAATADSVPRRDSNGRIKASAGVDPNDVVIQSQIGTAANHGVITSPKDTTDGRVILSNETNGYFGLGGRNGIIWNDYDDYEIPCGFYSVPARASGTFPSPTDTAGQILVFKRFGGSSAQIAQIFVPDNNQEIYWRNAYGGGWQTWKTFYHSGNSVNPLDHGISRIVSGVLYPVDDLDSASCPTGFYTVTNNIPQNGTRPAGLGIYGYIEVIRYDNGAIKQEYTDVSGRKAFRVIKNGVSENWQLYYHSGNTNFNEFGGIATDDLIMKGFAASSNVIVMYAPLNSKVSPTSISVEGTFRLPSFTGNLATGISGTDMVLQSTKSTNKWLVIDITGLSGLSVGTPVELRSESATSKITVNF
ncbi:MAG: hypothetical protein CMO80_22285 [Verrucomicrobiales bacterium]|nr:hypothetical protein [Verrucomicrobiales bacterium]|tara:strand:+ start:51217 stop:52602 length:1386 start_codon:yes stop_codon:yes gene_type:complete